MTDIHDPKIKERIYKRFPEEIARLKTELERHQQIELYYFGSVKGPRSKDQKFGTPMIRKVLWKSKFIKKYSENCQKNAVIEYILNGGITRSEMDKFFERTKTNYDK
jgi:hypothetical protein